MASCCYCWCHWAASSLSPLTQHQVPGLRTKRERPFDDKMKVRDVGRNPASMTTFILADD
ncbi:hypothetical protein PspLS_01628 [Pyricularia sp. CBS 133598]|nr:hypothetical protein PspLS_01628 [Pyricularia sp. CBS 133598]